MTPVNRFDSTYNDRVPYLDQRDTISKLMNLCDATLLPNNKSCAEYILEIMARIILCFGNTIDNMKSNTQNLKTDL
ncbi:hypothetical protein RclHR1_09280005 [Rhizophagus clarus]|uniref:Uncharacterized protein n=1 Tax=Rhizophagus clarus TaxID=94130 RepID=A0A2Z6S3Y5_9GLOM|nr:hypothetical protein RclHR1_09280005 [Rhizophagus clarus]